MCQSIVRTSSPVTREAHVQNGTLGLKVARTRIRRSLTQEELATRAGVSTPLVFKIEQGRHNGSITTIYRLAEALGVPTAFLFEESDEVEQDHVLLAAMRDVIFPAAPPEISEGDLAIQALRRRVVACATNYDRGHYEKLAADMPPLIRAIEASTGDDALRLLSQIYELAARILIQLRDESLACVAVERAMAAAERVGDPILRASAGHDYWWAFKRQKRFEHAETVATRLAAEIEPSITMATLEHLAVWGKLLNAASIAAAHRGRLDTANELLSLAFSSAVRVGERSMDYERYWAAFSPATIAITSTENALITGDASLALHLGRTVRRGPGQTLSAWSRHLLVMAEAQTVMREYASAIETIKAIHRIAPEWLKNHRVAHEVVLRLLDATTVPRHKKTGLDKLAAFMGVKP